jgi:aminocarboxymuconate-semialdehyde decarboxylase
MRFANERTREVQRQQTERTHIQLTSVEKRLADMDVMGIEMQAISPAPVQMYHWAEPDLGLATARVVNDNIAGIVARHPDRFAGMGTVPLQAPELAITEIERLVGSLGMRGVEISSNVAGEISGVSAIIGAVGISGDTSENDETCAVHGIQSAGLVPDTGDPAA